MSNSKPRNAGSSGQVATAIRVALARKNTTQSALANHLCLSQPAIHRRMAGKVSWRLSELSRAADFLGISLADLLGTEDRAAS